jgi:tRNA-specific 2-thiouridylase
VEGVYVRTWSSGDGLGACPWGDDLESARAVADFLSSPLGVVTLIDDYRRWVVEPMVAGYADGRTPNPDMLCNRHIKFGKLLDHACGEGFNCLATGHHCRIRRGRDGPMLLTGADPAKDQSYFLALVQREALVRVVFPIGHGTKAQVRELAKRIGLPNAERKDSQDICFLGGKISIQEFLKGQLGERRGEIVNRHGRVLGYHRGLFNHTLGQRKGLGLPSNCDFENYVVIGKDPARNRLIVDFASRSRDILETTSAVLHSLNFLCEPLLGRHRLRAKVRYRDPFVPISIIFDGAGGAEVRFDHPQRALAPGQTLALYSASRLLGGGIYAG